MAGQSERSLNKRREGGGGEQIWSACVALWARNDGGKGKKKNGEELENRGKKE